jgi:dihydrofolate reductase
MTAIIVAYARNRVIGKDNKLPWRLPAEMKHFRTVTTGHPVVMGKNTYLDIASRLKHGLPDRRNIVVSTSLKQVNEGFELTNSLNEAIAKASSQEPGDTIYISGGAQLYESALYKGLVDCIYATEIDAEIDGDVWFPAIKESDWQEVSHQKFTRDSENQYDFNIRLLRRKK